jgi:iron complex outermembrane receptor protein
VQLDGSFGSYGTQKETFKFGSGIIGNHWAFDGRLSNISSDGYIKRASAKLDSYFLQGGYFNKNTVIKFITFNGQEKTYHAWNYATKEEMLQHGRTYNSCGEYYNGNDTLYYKNQTDFYQQQHYQLFWNQILSPSLNLNVALHYTHGFGYYEEYKLDQLLSEYNLSSSLGSNSDLVRQTKEKNDF